MVTTRSRVLFGESGKYMTAFKSGGVIFKPSVQNISYQQKGYQVTSSSGHSWPPRSKIDKQLDIGGGFLTQRVEVKGGGVQVYLEQPTPNGNIFSGKLFAHSENLTKTSANLLNPASSSQMNAWGATGIARSLPTNPLAGMGQFLGEIRDIPRFPVLGWKGLTEAFRNLGRTRDGKRFFQAYAVNRHRQFLQRESALGHIADDHLNLMFGWVPFVKDVKDFAKVSMHASREIQKYDRGSGRITRSGTTILNDSSSSVTDFGLGSGIAVPSLVSPLVKTIGRKYLTSTVRNNVYFKGAFTYWLPPPGSTGIAQAVRVERLASKLYGIRPTPELLWQLAPWSWAVDWVSNVGDIIHNWSAFAQDGLVMKYGYVMQTITQTDEYSIVGFSTINGPLPLTQTVVTTVKNRVRATPYGFGLDTSGFTPKQWSIIGALGISRAPRSLNF